MNFFLSTLFTNTTIKKTGMDLFYLIKILNLRGYEIEKSGKFFYNLKNSIYLEKKKKNIQNNFFELKIPSHRLELLNQNILLLELSSIINTKYNNTWNLNQSNYRIIRKSNNINNTNIFSWKSSYYIFFNNKVKTNNWIKKKLLEFNYISTNTILDIFYLVSIEFNVNFKFISSFNTFIHFSVEKIMDETIYPFLFNRLLTLLDIYSIKKIYKYTNNFESKLSIIESKFNINNSKLNIFSFRKETFKKYFKVNNWDLNLFKNFKIPIISLTKTEIFFLIPRLRTDILKEVNLIDEYCKFFEVQKITKPLENYFSNKRHSQFIYYNMDFFIKNYFILKGFEELITNPLSKYAKNSKNSLLIENPLNDENIKLRESIVESLLNQFEKKKQKLQPLSRLRFFEIGRIFSKNSKQIIKEESHIGILFEVVEKDYTFSNSWFEIKSLIENFFKCFSNLKFYSKIALFTTNEESYYHPYKTIHFFSNNKKIGTLGLLNPKLKRKLKLTNNLFLFEGNLSNLQNLKLLSLNFSFKPFSKFPLITRDLSLNISKEFNFFDLQQTINKISPFVINSYFFDLFLINEKNNILNLSLKLELTKINETFQNEEIQEMLFLISQTLKDLYKIKIK